MTNANALTVPTTGGLGITSPDYTWRPAQYVVNVDLTSAIINGQKVGSQAVQKAQVVLNMELSLYSYRPSDDAPVEKFLLVSLEGSEVHPTSKELMFDQDDRRGWFTEYVDLHMAFAGAGHSLQLVQSSPDTTAVSGSASITSSIDFNVSGGKFGKDPMITAGVGGSISKSFSVNLEDYQIENKSTDTEVYQRIHLGMTEGGVFKVPTDLVPQDAGTWVANFLKNLSPPGRLYDLPPKAKANLSFCSMALFHAPKNISENQLLQVTGEYGLLMVEKTFVGVVNSHVGQRTIPFHTVVIVPFDVVI